MQLINENRINVSDVSECPFNFSLFLYLMKINGKRLALRYKNCDIYSHISNRRIHKGKYFLSMICPPSKVYNRNAFFCSNFIFFLLVWFVQEDNLSKLSNVEKLIRTFKCHDGKIDYICSRWKAIYLCNYTDHKFIVYVYVHINNAHILLIKIISWFKLFIQEKWFFL